MTKYIFRFDDLSKYSDIDKWKTVLDPFVNRALPALIAVIPDCKDEKLMKREPISEQKFWSFVKSLKMLDLGMHGLHHENYHLMSKEQQGLWMMESMKMFAKRNIIPNVFVPPNHGINRYTLPAMKSLGMEFLSEGIGLYPWKDDETDIMVVPQLLWTPREMPFGTITFCLHPDTMTDEQVENVKKFVVCHSTSMTSVCDVEPTILSMLNVPFVPIYRHFYNKKGYSRKR